MKCLASDTAERYRDVHDLSGALAAALASYEPPPMRSKAPSALPFAPVNGPSNTIPPPIAAAAAARAVTPLPVARAASAPPIARAVTPMPTSRPIATDRIARVDDSRGTQLMIAVAIILFLSGVGLLVAWML
jgi:hypothetical protein